MKNNSSQSRFQKITAKVIVMLLAVVLSLSVLPALSADLLPEADAATEYVAVAGTSAAAISTKLQELKNSGETVVDLKLDGDVDFTDKSSRQYSNGFTGITIPEGLTVNLFMNGKTIKFERHHVADNPDQSGAWQLPYVYGIHNKGNLNIYSGASVNGAGNANISIVNARTNMGNVGKAELAYVNLEAIRNEGNLTVNAGVNINVNATLHYDKLNSVSAKESAQVSVGATGIYNTKDSATCTVNGAKITTYVWGEGSMTSAVGSGERTSSAAATYGIYGGDITINGATAIKATGKGIHSRGVSGGNAGDGAAYITSIAYGVATNGKVEMNGGTITHGAELYNFDAAKSEGGGQMFLYSGGIYTTSASPVITDGTINTSISTCVDLGSDHGAITFRKGAVVTSSEMIKSAHDIVTYMLSHRVQAKVTPAADVTAGSYRDEADCSYSDTGFITTAVNTVSKDLIRGAVAGQNRIHVVYRYWTDSTRKTLDTSIEDADGNKGFSYRPSTSKPTVVSNPVIFTGLSNTKLTMGNNTAIRYQTGGDACNHYYWDLFKISYQSPGANWFSDYSITFKGTEFQTFEETGATNGQANVTNGPLYIYVDYISKAPSSIKANVGTAGVVTTTYTGSNILASQLGLQIIDAIEETDITNEYNIDFNNTSLINVSFSFTGKNTAGVEISDTGRLPRNAGQYQVTLHIDESVTYNTDPNKSKNRKSLDYTFTLIVEQAEVLRGTLPESFNLTYGQKLNDVISVGTGTYKADSLGNDNVSGMFAFVNAGDGSAYKNAGTAITQIKWTPAYPEGALEKNYKETVFAVTYNVAKAPLYITPNAATVVYGEEEVTFGSVITGLVANDNTAAVQKEISEALVYTVYYGGDYIAYQAGKIAAGSHVIRTSFTAPPAVLANYEYTHKYGANDNPDGVLRVTPRGLRVEATAQDRAYIPNNFDVNVSFSIASGKFGTDDVRVTNAIGKLDQTCDAGQLKIVNGISADNIKGNLAGGAKDNYEIIEVIYKSGKDLLVNISKAIPDAAIPTVSEMNYTQKRTLADVALGTTAGTVEGSWQWVDSTVNPTVKVAQYKAQFVPVDQKNYEIKVVDVTINVKPTPVTVGYSATVSYGDNIPNITNYTYTSDIDTEFDIKKVTTSGNITPRTDYQKGSPVKAGGYAVTINAPNYVDVDGNYIFTVNNGVINVNPRLITFKVEDKTIVYGDSFNVDSTGAVTLTFDENLLVGSDTINSITASGAAPSFSFETNYNNFNNFGAGTYTLNATCTSTTSANYTVAVEAGTLYVTKAPLVIKANDFTLEYGSEVPANLANALTLIGAKRNEKLANIVSTGSISVNTDYEQGSPVKAGGYEVTVGIAGATFNNYEVTVQNGTITVIKATPVITTLPTAAITYGQTLGDAVFSGAVIADGVKGTFVYESPAVQPAYNPDPYNSFTASFIPEDTDNYNVVSGKIVSLTVGKKTVTGVLSVAGIPMAGEGLTVDVTGLDPATAGSYSFVWYDKAGNILGTGAELTLGDDAAAKEIYVTATAATPYEGTVKSAYVLIAPELTDINTILATDVFVLKGLEFGGETKLVYDAQQKVVTFHKDAAKSANYEIGGIKVKYNGSTEAPVNVGRYAVTVDVATPTDLAGLTFDADAKVWKNAKGAVVYSPVSNYSVGYLEITPKGYTVYVEADEKIYDGTVDATATVTSEEGAVILAGGIKDKVTFNNSKVNYYFDTPAAGTDKNVYAFDGEYLTGDAAANYELTIVITNADSAVIKPMPLKVTVSAVEREYYPGDTSVDLSFAFTPAEGDEGDVYVDAATAKGTLESDIAGDFRRVTVSGIRLIGDKASNYELVIVNADSVLAKIAKAEPSYPIPEVHGVLYYDSGRHLNSISLPGSADGKWEWVDRNAVPGAGVHTFKAVYTPVDQANYKTVEYDVAVEVLKTPVKITAASFTITYGDIEPTYYYIAEGLTGADTIENAIDGYVLMNCNYQPGSKVGTYVIQLDGAFESDNYEFIYENGAVTVGKRTAYVDVIAENREYKAGDTTVKVKFSALENLFSGDTASDVYLQYTNYITGTIIDADAGTKTVQYEMPKHLGTKAENYVISPKKAVVTVEILKATIPGVNLPTSGIVYYGNKLSTIEFTSGSEGGQFGTFTMENPSSTPDKVGTFDKKYRVVFTPYDTKNYATITQFITVEVLPAFINVSLHFTGTIQVGKTLYVILNDIPTEAIPNLVFEWYRVDTPESDPRTGVKVASGTDSYRLTEEDGGKYIMCAVTNIDGSPYECNAICVTEIAVEEQQLTFWQKFVNWFYRLISNFTQIFGGLLG